MSLHGQVRAAAPDRAAPAAYDALSPRRKRQHVLAVEGAKEPVTPVRRIVKVLETLRGQAPS